MIVPPKKKHRGDIPYIIVASRRTEFHGNVVAKNFCESFQYLKSEAGSVLDTSTPLICAKVGGIVQELGDEVSVGSMY